MFGGVIYDRFGILNRAFKAPQSIGQFARGLDGDIAAVITAHQAGNAACFDICAARGGGLNSMGELFAIRLARRFGVPIVAFACIANGYPSCQFSALLAS
jgi:hypothetical protein